MVAPMQNHASLIGHTVGPYEIQALIGRGAMATVYLARDTALGRLVALKVLLGSLARNPEQVRQFQREAQSAALLQHPHIVGVYEAGVRDGIPFIAMEYVEGEPLDRFLRRQGKLPWRNALHLAYQVAQALDCAHRAGIVHCDVKPSNILIGGDGTVRLTDFGIARAGTSGDRSEVIGTPAWMSPEQCAGEAKLGPASDLFSLGVLLYQMLTAQMPFDGDTAIALMHRIMHEAPKPLRELSPDVPDDVARLTGHLMQKAPGMRLHSAEAVCKRIVHLQREDGGMSALPEALNAFVRDLAEPRTLKGMPAAQPRKNKKKATRPVVRRAVSRRRWMAVAAAALAVVGIVFVGVGGWFGGAVQASLPDAPTLESLVIREAAEGLRVDLPSANWQIADMNWVGGLPVLAVYAQGMPGSLLEGSWGVLSVDLSSRKGYSTRAPSGSVFDPEYAENRIWMATNAGIPAASETSPFFEAFPLVRPSRYNQQCMAVVAQRWDEGIARPTEWVRFPRSAWNSTGILSSGTPSDTSVVVNPEGLRMALALKEPDGSGLYIEERVIGEDQADTPGIRLVSSGTPLLPQSISYAPGGRSLAFLTASGQLWVASSGGEKTGHRLAEGPFDGPLAWSPDGRRVAVSGRGGNGTEIQLIRLPDGQAEGSLGPGRVQAASWHPSGHYLVVMSDDPGSGGQQLFAVNDSAPYKRKRIARIEGGAASPAAVSPDGDWAAVASGRQLVFAALEGRGNGA